MSNEIAISYINGKTVTADVFQPTGAVREAAIALTENGTGGLYLGDCATITPGDLIVGYDDGVYVGGEEYSVVAANYTADKAGFKLASDGLDSVSTAEPAGVASNFREMLVQVWRRFFKKTTATKSQLKTYTDAGAANTTQTVTHDGTTKTVGNAS